MPRSDYTLKTLRKGLEVLETLADDRGALTLTALAERLRESPPVVFRILRTLEERGYVEQDASSKRWHPGFRAWEIGCRVINRTGLVEAARPLLKTLTEFTEETSAIVRGTDMVYLDTVVGPARRDPTYRCVDQSRRTADGRVGGGRTVVRSCRRLRRRHGRLWPVAALHRRPPRAPHRECPQGGARGVGQARLCVPGWPGAPLMAPQPSAEGR